MKTKILSILALLLMTVTQGAWAQETLTVYDGTQWSPFSPVYMNRFDMLTRSQYIIPAANLEAMKGKIITALKYYSNKSNYTSTCDVDVYLKEVGYTTFNSTPTFETKSGIVYTGTLSIAGDGTLTITFTTPYTYNGGNLLIGMENTETGNSILSSFSGQNVTGTVAFGSSSTNRGDFIPKTTFTYETPVPPTPVDLGLPSGTRWADMNVGAGSATGYGTYFAWAATASQADYSQANAPYYSGSAYTKYTGSDYTMLQRGDDAATVNWGSNWRMPTDTELQELIDNTTKEWKTNYNGTGVNGYLVTSKTNGNSIFLPAAGWYNGTELRSASQGGNYWMSTVVTSDVRYGYSLNFYSTGNPPYKDNTDTRYVGFSIRPVQMFAGEGTQASPYLIASTTDWNNLVTTVNGGETYSGKYFQMTANVGTVSTWMTGTFSGTFDGDGNTLTVGYSSSANGCAPFGNLRAATIKNLIVDGTISTSGERAGGIAWWVLEGSMTYITNCRVAATINSTFSGGASTGGFVGSVQDYETDGKLTITGCAFTGSLLGSSTHTCGGFVGWNGGTLTIENSLFAPASVTMGTTYSATFTRGGTVTNSYYTQKFNEAQGMQARTIVKGDGVSTLSVTKGDATATYDVSGIKVYSGGIDFNDGSTTTFYGGSGQTVSLALTAETRTGYQFKQYAASQGTLSGQTTDAPTLTMPAANSTANDVVTISAEYDPTYNATFADGNDNTDWTIDPTSGVAGTSVTVSYTGENKVKSVTVAPKGALTGKFSVSSTKQVQFSKGNLQYDGSAWSFHTNQYDCVFTSEGTATGYPMDIFCWGNIDNPAYGGSTGIGTNGVDLSGSSDWGSNTITNGCTGWRTLTWAEWEYLFANHSYGYATVAGQTGIIILPDVFTDPMRNNGSAAFVASTASWTANVYAAGDDWTAMEKAGALFLPAAGGRDGSYIGSVGIKGSYWSSTAYTTHGRFIVFQAGSAPETTNYSIHGYGKSVRLVRDVE